VYQFRAATDLDECREVWERVFPPQSLTDLWELRLCFHRYFQRPPCFLVAEDADGVCGLVPLSWIEESACYGYFPGETWEGKTWLEQNRVFVRSEPILTALLERCPSTYSLRYLLPPAGVPREHCAVDEVGYLFLPPRYGFDLENYFQAEFSHRNAKRVKRDVNRTAALGVSYRYDDLADFEHLLRLNMERFGERSYFADTRFREGFRSAVQFLHQQGWLRVTTLLIQGEPAAVDVGCMRDGTYTLLAGGTDSRYPGVAKLINLHHMQRACQERLEQVDFLCGDFSWKTLFHLTPRPLYLLSNAADYTRQSGGVEAGSAARVE